MSGKGEVIIYKTPDGETSIDVKLENETVWLTTEQMATLFQRDRTVIGRHISNIFKEGELDPKVVRAFFAHTTPHGAIAAKTQEQNVTIYNLDVVISVGYRVHSIRGTQFRIWASNILKDYLIKGYAVNHKIKNENYRELKELVRLVGRTLEAGKLQASDETQSLFNVVVDYSYALDTLDSYDYQNLTIEEKAAMLLYLVVKNHSFTDGNKRIAASLFLWFMNKNNILYSKDGSKRIADNTLVAMTLMIAESRPEEMNMMVKVVVNLINSKNE